MNLKKYLTSNNIGNGISIVKSFSFPDGEIRGDMFYIQHNSSNFTVIDCYLKDGEDRNCRENEIINEIVNASRNKRIHRFISTHPDNDHILGLKELDEAWGITKFYAVENNIPADNADESLSTYIRLKSKKCRQIERGVTPKYQNEGDDRIYSSNLNFEWPILASEKFKTALESVAKGGSPNNISCITTYRAGQGTVYMWMGDLETDMQQEYYDYCKGNIPQVDILFQPHHGRKSGAVPNDLLKALNPKLIVIGNAPSEYIDYGNPDITITQNTAGDIVFVNHMFCVDIYTQNQINNPPKCLKKLKDRGFGCEYGFYCGTLVHNRVQIDC